MEYVRWRVCPPIECTVSGPNTATIVREKKENLNHGSLGIWFVGVRIGGGMEFTIQKILFVDSEESRHLGILPCVAVPPFIR